VTNQHGPPDLTADFLLECQGDKNPRELLSPIGRGQPNGLSRARCSCAIAVLVRRLSCRLPRRSAAVGLQIEKKRKQSEAKEILDAWQKTADRAVAGNLDQARIREIILETVERVTGKRDSRDFEGGV
jgi:hypothetical protein